MFTRKDYMNKICTHREYYAQYVTPKMKSCIARIIGTETLVKSTDEHLNDIRLSVWDNIGLYAVNKTIKQQFRDNGDFITPAGVVCLLKEAAKQLIEDYKEDVSDENNL